MITNLSKRLCRALWRTDIVPADRSSEKASGSCKVDMRSVDELCYSLHLPHASKWKGRCKQRSGNPASETWTWCQRAVTQETSQDWGFLTVIDRQVVPENKLPISYLPRVFWRNDFIDRDILLPPRLRLIWTKRQKLKMDFVHEGKWSVHFIFLIFTLILMFVCCLCVWGQRIRVEAKTQ